MLPDSLDVLIFRLQVHRGAPEPEPCQTSFVRSISFDFQLSRFVALSSISLVYEGVSGVWPPSSFILAQPCDVLPHYAGAQARVMHLFLSKFTPHATFSSQVATV